MEGQVQQECRHTGLSIPGTDTQILTKSAAIGVPILQNVSNSVQADTQSGYTSGKVLSDTYG